MGDAKAHPLFAGFPFDKVADGSYAPPYIKDETNVIVQRSASVADAVDSFDMYEPPAIEKKDQHMFKDYAWNNILEP